MLAELAEKFALGLGAIRRPGRLLQSRQHILAPCCRLPLLSQGEGGRANVAVLARQRDDFRMDVLKVLVRGPGSIEERLARLERDWRRQNERCLDGNDGACRTRDQIADEIAALLPTIPYEAERAEITRPRGAAGR